MFCGSLRVNCQGTNKVTAGLMLVCQRFVSIDLQQVVTVRNMLESVFCFVFLD